MPYRLPVSSRACVDEGLAQAAQVDAFILDGGIEAWKKAGLPVAQDRKQPIEIMR